MVRSCKCKPGTKQRECILTTERPRIIENQKKVFCKIATKLLANYYLIQVTENEETYVKYSLAAEVLRLLNSHDRQLEHHSPKSIPA